MQWTFKLGGEETTFTVLEKVAVKPTSDFLKIASPSDLAVNFGEPVWPEVFEAADVEQLPYDQLAFVRTGWWFVSPHPGVAIAAEARTAIPKTEAVQQVFLSETNRLLLGTDLATVRLHKDLSQAAVTTALEEDQLEIVYRLGSGPNTFEVSLPPHRSLPEIINRLQEKTDRYLYAEPSLLQVIAGRMKPTDLLYSRQWHHYNDGSKGGVFGADLDSEGAWNITRGVGPDRPVRIAIIDNSMQVSHPDFDGGIFGGGYFMKTEIWKASFKPLKPSMTDFPSGHHGTFCMGMAGARMNNGKGGCGSAPESHLIPIACLDDQTGTQTTLARAINYSTNPMIEDDTAQAADGTDVISCSLDTGGLLQSGLKDAIHFASTKGRDELGIPVFWAVSNKHVKISLDKLCSDHNVIPVGRSNRRGMSDGSAFGPELEFLAPGDELFSTRADGHFNVDTGTSFSTPLAAGVAALVIAVNPKLTGAEVRQILRRSCVQINGAIGERDDEYGFGLLSAEKAVENAAK